MKSNEKAGCIITSLVFAFWIAAVGGWIINIFKLTNMTLNPVTMELILRILGILAAPLGAVMGYL